MKTIPPEYSLNGFFETLEKINTFDELKELLKNREIDIFVNWPCCKIYPPIYDAKEGAFAPTVIEISFLINDETIYTEHKKINESLSWNAMEARIISELKEMIKNQRT